MFLLCGTEGRRQATGARIEALSGVVDFGRFVSLAARQRLLPLAAMRAQEMLPAARDPRWRVELSRLLEASRRRGELLEQVVLGLLAALDRAGIGAMPLKGPLLARSIYGNPGLRPASDVDILVAPDRLESAVALAQEMGYAPPRDPVLNDGYPVLHYHLDHGSSLPPLELHWRIHWYETRFAQDMLRRSTQTESGRHAQPEDELASLVLFFCRDGFLGLRLAADVAAWWDRHRSQVSPPVLDGIAGEYPELRPALAAGSVALADLVGIPAAEVLSSALSLDWRSQAAVRLSNWPGSGARRQMGANVTLVDWLLSPSGGGRAFVRRSLIPSRDSIEEMYGPASAAWWRRVRLRALHGPKLLARWAFALWRVRGSRFWAPLPPSVP
jgi:Uncharacterised nucleotidyltransferase